MVSFPQAGTAFYNTLLKERQEERLKGGKTTTKT
jgi:hypothetical protein